MVGLFPVLGRGVCLGSLGAEERRIHALDLEECLKEQGMALDSTARERERENKKEREKTRERKIEKERERVRKKERDRERICSSEEKRDWGETEGETERGKICTEVTHYPPVR